MASLLVCGLGEWITPKVKGDCPPPCAGFTLTKISQNSAVLLVDLIQLQIRAYQMCTL